MEELRCGRADIFALQRGEEVQSGGYADGRGYVGRGVARSDLTALNPLVERESGFRVKPNATARRRIRLAGVQPTTAPVSAAHFVAIYVIVRAG